MDNRLSPPLGRKESRIRVATVGNSTVGYEINVSPGVAVVDPHARMVGGHK